MSTPTILVVFGDYFEEPGFADDRGVESFVIPADLLKFPNPILTFCTYGVKLASASLVF